MFLHFSHDFLAFFVLLGWHVPDTSACDKIHAAPMIQSIGTGFIEVSTSVRLLLQLSLKNVHFNEIAARAQCVFSLRQVPGFVVDGSTKATLNTVFPAVYRNNILGSAAASHYARKVVHRTSGDACGVSAYSGVNNRCVVMRNRIWCRARGEG